MDRRWQDFLEQARRARTETPPAVDVTHRVLATIAAQRAASRLRAEQRPVLYCAAAALLAASVVALLASGSWLTLNDPLSDLVAGIAVLEP